MVCIYCGGETKVTNSRSQKRANATWRRRECLDCGAVVTTLEKIDLETAVSVLAERHSEPFSRDKLLISIFESCKHRKDAHKVAPGLTDTVLKQLEPLISGGALDVEQIITTTSTILERFDEVAAVYYRAYHKS
jgi:transcriptional repressor NrdR